MRADRRRLDGGILRRLVEPPHSDGGRGMGELAERDGFVGRHRSTLQLQGVHRCRRELCGVVGFGGDEISLRGDVHTLQIGYWPWLQ